MFSDQVADHLVKFDEEYGDQENLMMNMSQFLANLSLNENRGGRLSVHFTPKQKQYCRDQAIQSQMAELLD